MLTVYQNRRWDPDFMAVRRAVETGLLGDVFNVETFVGGYEHPCRTWHSDTAVSGGAGYDWGSHHVDWVLCSSAGCRGWCRRTATSASGTTSPMSTSSACA